MKKPDEIILCDFSLRDHIQCFEKIKGLSWLHIKVLSQNLGKVQDGKVPSVSRVQAGEEKPIITLLEN